MNPTARWFLDRSHLPQPPKEATPMTISGSRFDTDPARPIPYDEEAGGEPEVPESEISFPAPRAEEVDQLDPVAVAVRTLLRTLGVAQHEPEHTADTPRRVAAAYRHQLAGYAEDPRKHLAKTFPAPASPGLVVVSGLNVSSMCAHHLLPITGVATVAYRAEPGQPVVGLSKLARLLDGYGRRLQVQEQLGYQVATALQEELNPIGAACIITAEHGCMTLRGVMQKGSRTTTTAWAGDWDLNPLDADRVAVLAEHQKH